MERTGRQKRLATIRWLWIVPTAILVWYGVLALSQGLYTLAIGFCPAEQLLSGFCTADWFRPWERGIVVGCAGLAGFAIVLATALVAPDYRLRAAVVMFGAGALLATSMAWQTNAFAEFVASLVGGVLGIVVAARLPQSIEL